MPSNVPKRAISLRNRGAPQSAPTSHEALISEAVLAWTSSQ